MCAHLVLLDIRAVARKRHHVQLAILPRAERITVSLARAVTSTRTRLVRGCVKPASPARLRAVKRERCTRRAHCVPPAFRAMVRANQQCALLARYQLVDWPSALCALHISTMKNKARLLARPVLLVPLRAVEMPVARVIPSALCVPPDPRAMVQM